MINFNNGAKGMFWTSVMARGGVYGLRIRIFGSKGSLEWIQNDPNYLKFNPSKGAVRLLERGFFNADFSKKFSRIKFGHPEGYLDAFANIYLSISKLFLSKKRKRNVPLILNLKENFNIMSILNAMNTASKKNNWIKTFII